MLWCLYHCPWTNIYAHVWKQETTTNNSVLHYSSKFCRWKKLLVVKDDKGLFPCELDDLRRAPFDTVSAGIFFRETLSLDEHARNSLHRLSRVEMKKVRIAHRSSNVHTICNKTSGHRGQWGLVLKTALLQADVLHVNADFWPVSNIFYWIW